VFVRSRRWNHLVSLSFVLAMGACGNISGCGACSTVAPLPAGGLPATQTVEGGAQIRVTPQGFAKLTSILPGVLSSAFGNGFTFGGGSVVGGLISYCNGSGGNCTVSVGFSSLSTTVTNQQTLQIAINANASTNVPLSFDYLLGTATCTMGITIGSLSANADIAFGINATTGELTISLADVNSLMFSNVSVTGCGILSDIGQAVIDVAEDVLDSGIGQFVVQLLTPTLSNLIQGLLPNPLGIAGELNIGSLLASVSPETQAEMEARIEPGGYVSLDNGGMSLGVISGINSDIDPTGPRTGTRPDGIPYASQPSLCVPPLNVPLWGEAPYNLPTTTRGTFSLSAASALDGNPDPTNTDLAMGVSQTMLDQLGHFAVTSGALCLGIGTQTISELNVGTIGILVPSLSDLDPTGKAPLLLVTRPQRVLQFTIGENTTNSPAITIDISHLQVDFYAFLFERYVRAFTLDLSLNVGVNLTFETNGSGSATITPMILGINANNVELTVLNSEFVKETPAHLEMVLPSVFSLLTPLLGNIAPISVPSFAGFSLNNLSIQKLTTTQDTFLALLADLGASQQMRVLGQLDPYAQATVDSLDQSLASNSPPPSPRSAGAVALVSVNTPPPDVIDNGLGNLAGGKLPTITFQVDATDKLGRQLEWSWNFNGGLWHVYRPGGTFEIADPAFAWQGKYTIGLKSRVVGDYRTTSDEIDTPVVIDSVGPHIFTNLMQLEGETVIVPVTDVVSGKNNQIAFGKVGAATPVTAWMDGSNDARISFDQAMDIGHGGAIQIFARDEVGNQSTAAITPFTTATTTSSGCATGNATGVLPLIAILGGLLVGRRRSRAWLVSAVRRARRSRALASIAVWAIASVALSFAPACSCKNAAKSCEMNSDCPASSCPAGQLPFCVQNTCVCSDDVPPGYIGLYESVAVGSGGSIWVSAYSENYGDLVVAEVAGADEITCDDASCIWQWVDGVPNVTPEIPGSKIRGGITDLGPNVGMYTSIQVAPNNIPMVSYFDVDNASLKFASFVNNAWQIHTVDAGTGTLGSNSGSLVGMYTSMTLRGDNNYPGIAYLAHVGDANGQHAELRFAQATVAQPSSAADWTVTVADTAALPAANPNMPDVFPLPEGLGLWISAARDATDQSPVLAYYDRAAGELKLVRYVTANNAFGTPVVLAGGLTDGQGNDGWTPTVQVDSHGVANVSYIDATNNSLMYITDAAGATAQVVDNGYRIVGQTVDGLPEPTFDILDNASIVLPPGAAPIIAYQDGTTQELLAAQLQSNNTWTHVSIAGATNPWPGAYGFFVSAANGPDEVVMSNWVVDQPTGSNWVQVFAKPAVIQ
jgi:hypothetical protein